MRSFEDYTQELKFVADLLKDLQISAPDDSICVLARNNRLLEDAFEESSKAGVNCEKSRRKTDFENPYVLLFYLLLKLENHRNDLRVLKQIIVILDQALSVSINLDELLANADLSNNDYLSALANEIKERLAMKVLKRVSSWNCQMEKTLFHLSRRLLRGQRTESIK